MSYILEALKKLEEKRREESVPHILTVPNIPAKSINKRSLWPYFILMALLLNAGLLLWWLQTSGKAKIAVPAIDRHLLRTSPSIGHISRAMQDRQLPSSPSVNNPDLYAVTPDVPARTTETDPSYENKQARNFSNPDGAEQKPAGTHELPLSLKQELPDLSISGHYYDSNPASRLVVINGKSLREGQIVMPGIKLEQIIASGVILSYQGYRFTKGVF